MPRGKAKGSTNGGKVLCVFGGSDASIMLMLSGSARTTKRFEKIHQEAQKRFEQARLNGVPLEDLEAECYAEIAITSKGTNAAHICRAILNLIEEARSMVLAQGFELSPAPKTSLEDPAQKFELGPAPTTASDEPPPEQPLTVSEQIYADRFKYRLEMGESREEAHIRAASEAQTYDMLVDYHREQARRESLDERNKEKNDINSETKEVNPGVEEGS
jgi:hypothetical protein